MNRWIVCIGAVILSLHALGAGLVTCALGAGLPTSPEPPTAGLPDSGDPSVAASAGSGDPRTTEGASRTSETAESGQRGEQAALTKQLWPRQRVEAALKALQQQRDQGLLSEAAYGKRKAMLEQRLAGRYESQTLSVTNPPLNFVQNGGFEKVNKNSAKDRSRWLWWGGWSWGGQYENSWEQRPEYVHSGAFSACIRCVGQAGRIGISTPKLPAVPGATGYRLTFWARGEGDNRLFVNFESGADGTLREQIPDKWSQYTLVGQPEAQANSYTVYFYAIGQGAIWLDDIELVPVGGTLEE